SSTMRSPARSSLPCDRALITGGGETIGHGDAAYLHHDPVGDVLGALEGEVADTHQPAERVQPAQEVQRGEVGAPHLELDGNLHVIAHGSLRPRPPADELEARARRARRD